VKCPKKCVYNCKGNRIIWNVLDLTGVSVNMINTNSNTNDILVEVMLKK
jgi:hypothetical protein